MRERGPAFFCACLTGYSILFQRRKHGVSFLGVFPRAIDRKLLSQAGQLHGVPGSQNLSKNPKELK